MAKPKTEFLQIRLTREDKARLTRAAEADHLDASTWARRALLHALEQWESRHGSAGAANRAQDR